MRLLLHICCAPCAIFPIKRLKLTGFSIYGYFYNPNIHPFREFKRRRNSVRELAVDEKISTDFSSEYDMENFLRQVVYKEEERCAHCYTMRLDALAKHAAENGFDFFSTTLLYSKYQNHDLIKQTSLNSAEKFGSEFYYEDFREGWEEGIEEAITRKYYRQPYCGCIYSEKERYIKKRKKAKKNAPNRF